MILYCMCDVEFNVSWELFKFPSDIGQARIYTLITRGSTVVSSRHEDFGILGVL